MCPFDILCWFVSWFWLLWKLYMCSLLCSGTKPACICKDGTDRGVWFTHRTRTRWCDSKWFHHPPSACADSKMAAQSPPSIPHFWQPRGTSDGSRLSGGAKVDMFGGPVLLSQKLLRHIYFTNMCFLVRIANKVNFGNVVRGSNVQFWCGLCIQVSAFGGEEQTDSGDNWR